MQASSWLDAIQKQKEGYQATLKENVFSRSSRLLLPAVNTANRQAFARPYRNPGSLHEENCLGETDMLKERPKQLKRYSLERRRERCAMI